MEVLGYRLHWRTLRRTECDQGSLPRSASEGGGGIKVCDGVLDEQLFDALVTNLPRRNEKKEKTVRRALLSELAAVTHIADVARGRRRAERAALLGLV